MISEDEIGTLDFMETAFEVFGNLAPDYGGALVKKTGDGILAEFASASQAVSYAVDVQGRLQALAKDGGVQRAFRIGIHLGEVERTDDDIFGHAVNIAARLEALAKPGGICVSHEVYRHARRATNYGFLSGGVKSLKNIPDAIATYHVAEDREDADRERLEQLTITTVDGLRISDFEGHETAVRSDRVRALIGYLALRPEFSETAERISALLWPDAQPASARRSLANCFRAARSVFDDLTPDIMYHEDGRLGLEPSRTEVDLAALLQEIASGSVDDLLIEKPDWPESILFGLDDVSALFRSWLRVTRHNWRTRMLESLEACLLRCEAPEVQARRAAMALLVLEPSHEKALQKLIQHHAAAGNLALAVKVFQEFAELLDESYGIAPSAETVELVEGLKRSRPSGALRQAAPPPVARRPRIAVGDFDADQADPATAHLVAGFRSELIANLSRFRDWVVVEEETGAVQDVDGRPDYRMSARCDKSHAQLTLAVILKDALSNRIVWSDRFEISIEKWFESQRLLVRRIAAHTEIYLSSDRLARAVGTDPVNVSDYNDWLRGEHLLSLWTRSGEDEAESILSSIIDRSPEFAPAYASLASIYNVRHLIRPGTPRDAVHGGRAFPLALKAVELDALDARNQQVIAWSSAMNARYQQAAVHYELATNLNGSSPKALFSCAQGLAFVGAKARARQLLDEAFRLAPFLLPYQWCYVASTNYMIGDYGAAVEAAERGGHATMDNLGWRAAALARLGRIAEAKAAFLEQVALVKDDWSARTPASAANVRDWFLDCFPIGEQDSRIGLAEMLDLAAG